MTFLHPVHVGELLTLTASVNAAWRTSMEVGVRVDRGEPPHRRVAAHQQRLPDDGGPRRGGATGGGAPPGARHGHRGAARARGASCAGATAWPSATRSSRTAAPRARSSRPTASPDRHVRVTGRKHPGGGAGRTVGPCSEPRFASSANDDAGRPLPGLPPAGARRASATCACGGWPSTVSAPATGCAASTCPPRCARGRPPRRRRRRRGGWPPRSWRGGAPGSRASSAAPAATAGPCCPRGRLTRSCPAGCRR